MKIEAANDINNYLNEQYNNLKEHANILDKIDDLKLVKSQIFSLLSNVMDFSKELITILNVMESMIEEENSAQSDSSSDYDTEEETSDLEFHSSKPLNILNQSVSINDYNETNNANDQSIVSGEEYINASENNEFDDSEDYIESHYPFYFDKEIEQSLVDNSAPYIIPEENQKMIDIMNKELFEKLQQIRNIEGEVNDVIESSL
jgi:hypothetical protein